MSANLIITIFGMVFASTGFWTLITKLLENRTSAKTNTEEMILGLAHDRIYELCKEYLVEGSITHSGYDNLIHLYRPYVKLGGNGTAKKLMLEVEKLPIVED